MIFKQNSPIYLQIAERIMDEILTGVYPANERIPSVREYGITLEVNVQSQQIIFTKRGLGYFVSENAPLQIRKLRKEQFFSEFLPQLAEKMKQLNISEEDLKKALAQYK